MQNITEVSDKDRSAGYNGIEVDRKQQQHPRCAGEQKQYPLAYTALADHWSQWQIEGKPVGPPPNPVTSTVFTDHARPVSSAEAKLIAEGRSIVTTALGGYAFPHAHDGTGHNADIATQSAGYWIDDTLPRAYRYYDVDDLSAHYTGLYDTDLAEATEALICEWFSKPTQLCLVARYIHEFAYAETASWVDDALGYRHVKNPKKAKQIIETALHRLESELIHYEQL